MDIAATVLNIAQSGALKTKIMYAAFMSYPQLKEYLGLLEENKLLEYDSKTMMYRATEKGKHFLDVYQELYRLLYPKESKTSSSSSSTSTSTSTSTTGQSLTYKNRGVT
jgi:predicted transcriptional regulator